MKTYRDMVEKNQRYAQKIREISVKHVTEMKQLEDLCTPSLLGPFM